MSTAIFRISILIDSENKNPDQIAISIRSGSLLPVRRNTPDSLTPSNCPLARISQTTPSRAGQESVKCQSAQILSGDGVLKHSEVDKIEQIRSLPAIDSRSRNEFEKCGLETCAKEPIASQAFWLFNLEYIQLHSY